MGAKLGILNCQVSNLANITKAVQHVGADAKIIESPSDFSGIDKLIIPGVGSFSVGMKHIRECGLLDPIKNFAASGKNILGICLGMQMLLSTSEEFGTHTGIGLIEGAVRLLPKKSGLKVPHVGWDDVRFLDTSNALGMKTGESNTYFFTHSYAAYPNQANAWLGESDSGYGRFASIVRNTQGNVVGCQFHLELSGPSGLAILRSFANA